MNNRELGPALQDAFPAFQSQMGDSPKPFAASDGGDLDALTRFTVTPSSYSRQKRGSLLNSAPTSSSGLDAVPSAEEQLVETLLAIEGDDISYDVFQFVLEMVRAAKTPNQVSSTAISTPCALASLLEASFHPVSRVSGCIALVQLV